MGRLTKLMNERNNHYSWLSDKTRAARAGQCLRPYHVENTGSCPITEVKQRRARLVLGWVTAWEYRVL